MDVSEGGRRKRRGGKAAQAQPAASPQASRRISMAEIEQVVAAITARRQAGRGLTAADYVAYLRKLTEAGGVQTLELLLPLALRLNGDPYTLHEHYPFSPVFACEMPKQLVIKSGRQVSKSTSLASHGVLLANCVPNFKTLYITPLYEQIRRFSNNYVRPFIDQSPIKPLWSGTSTENSVLQRSFRNLSLMIFSFALLDADRVRGVSADKSFREGSLVTTVEDDGELSQTPIELLQPGDRVLSFTSRGAVKVSRVKAVAYHGFRACWRLAFGNGREISATAESWVATNEDWQRVESIIQRGVRAAETASADGVGREPAANGARDAARRRLDGVPRKAPGLPLGAQQGPARVQLSQVPGLVRVHQQATRDSIEQRLREVAEPLADLRPAGFRALCQPLLPQHLGRRPAADAQACQRGMVKAVDLGGNRVLVHGRRLDSEVGLLDDQHARVQRRGGAAARRLADVARRGGEGEALQRQARAEDVPGALLAVRRHAEAAAGDSAVCAGVYELQTGGGPSCDGANLQILRGGLPRQGYGSQQAGRQSSARVLRGGGLCAAASEPGVCRGQEAEAVSPEVSGVRVVEVDETDVLFACYDGHHDVYDIEVEADDVADSTFFVNGIGVHNCAIDEVQNMDPDHLPIIRECMSHSKWGLSQYTGTPLSLDNPLEGLWQRSSQAEWFIKCAACGEYNIPSMDFHIEAMIGPWHPMISEHQPGIICHKPSCRKPINPRPVSQGGGGRWVHRKPEKRHNFAGYHIPQLILPLHACRKDKWAELLAKRETTAPNVFYNEVLGESVDVGQKLVTETDLKRACLLPWANNPNSPDPKMVKLLRHYRMKVLAVDWGGGGEDGVSFTTLALLGLAPDGKVHCLWGKRLLTPNDHIREAREIIHWVTKLGADLLAHDYTGAGIARETILVQAGYNLERIMPVQYVRSASRNLITHVPATPLHDRSHYRLDKTRSLLYTTQAIRLQLLQFFEWDRRDQDHPGLIGDFLALVEEKTESRLAGDIYTITRNEMLTDDFAQSVNIGCAALWHSQQCWPNFAEAAKVAKISQAMIQAAGNGSFGWSEDRSMAGYFGQP